MPGIGFNDFEILRDPVILEIATEIRSMLKSGGDTNEIIKKIGQRNWRRSDVYDALELGVSEGWFSKNEVGYELKN